MARGAGTIRSAALLSIALVVLPVAPVWLSITLVPPIAPACAGEPRLATSAPAAEQPRREDRGDLIVLHLYGSYREMGRQQTELLGPVARAVYDLQLREFRDFRARSGFGFVVVDRVAIPLIVWLGPLYEKSGLHAETNGMAEGLGVWSTDMTRASLAPAGGSTVFAATRGATADGGALIGRNVDWWDGYGRRRPVVIHYHPSNGDLAYVHAGWPLLGVPAIGINEAGFALSFNFFVTDTPVGTHLPQWPHRRALQTARSVEEGIRVFTAVRERGAPTFMVMADAEGDIAMLECTVAECAVYRPEGDWFGQANHARTPAMIPFDRYRSEDSLARRAAIEAAVRPHLGGLTPAVAAEIMRDRSNSRYVNDPTVANTNVLNSAVIQPAAKILWHSTTMQPLAPFGEMVPFSVAADASQVPALPADPRLNTPAMRHEAEVIAGMRRALQHFDAGEVAEAGAIWDGFAAAGEPTLQPQRLAWARARTRWTLGRLAEADTLLAALDTDATPFEVRASSLVVRAVIADRGGTRAAALDGYRRAQAYLDAHPQYTDKFVVVPLRAQVAAGLAAPQITGPFPATPDLQFVPR